MSPKELSPIAPVEEISREEKLERFENFGRISKEDDGKIIKDENEEIIQVKPRTYKELIKYIGGSKYLVLMNLTCIVTKVAETYLTWYIGQFALEISSQMKNSNRFAYVVIGLAVVCAIVAYFRNKIVSMMIFNAGNRVHSDIVKSVL